MGKEFGELAKISGITYFRLSPHEQKPFAGMISEGVPNSIRRLRGVLFRVMPFMLYTVLVMKWAKEEHHRLGRKNPALFANDK